MKALQLFFLIVASCIQQTSLFADDDDRPRLAVLTDIGGDPDDTQSLIRLMVYANEFQIEAIIASASGTRGELKEAIILVFLSSNWWQQSC